MSTDNNKELIAELRSRALSERFGIRRVLTQAADALEAAERDALDLKQFRRAVEATKRYGERLHAEGALFPEQYDRWDAEANRLLAIIDSQKDVALPAPPKKED